MKCHSSKYGKDLKRDSGNIIFVCRQCHDQIHAMFSNNELRDLYSTVDALFGDDKFRKYVEWRKKHLEFSFNGAKMSNGRRRK